MFNKRLVLLEALTNINKIVSTLSNDNIIVLFQRRNSNYYFCFQYFITFICFHCNVSCCIADISNIQTDLNMVFYFKALIKYVTQHIGTLITDIKISIAGSNMYVMQ